MSVLYATASELASYLQQDVDTATATLVLQTASQMFSSRADTMFAPTTVTYTTLGTGCTQLVLPFRPVTAVSAVRVATVVVTDYTRIKSTLYRSSGFGTWAFPPQTVEVDLTHGYATVPDDVKGAVLDMAALAYAVPVGAVTSESIDDYSVRFGNSSSVRLTPIAEDLADRYRGTWAG